MRTAIVMLMILAFAGSAVAADLGNKAPAKDPSNVPYVQPDSHKQGGDTIFDATPIPGLYWASMSQVYPWDRGTNYAVEIGQEVARRVMTDGL